MFSLESEMIRDEQMIHVHAVFQEVAGAAVTGRLVRLHVAAAG